MSKYHDAANVLKREANRFQELSATAKTLDEIGGLAQAADAEMSRAGMYKKESDALKDEIAKLKADAGKLKASQAEKQKEADDIYAKTIYNANTTAGELMKKADLDAKKIVADVQSSAAQELQNLAGQIAKMEAAKIMLNDEITALQQVSIMANTEAEAAEKRLKAVRDNIAKLTSL